MLLYSIECLAVLDGSDQPLLCPVDILDRDPPGCPLRQRTLELAHGRRMLPVAAATKCSFATLVMILWRCDLVFPGVEQNGIEVRRVPFWHKPRTMDARGADLVAGNLHRCQVTKNVRTCFTAEEEVAKRCFLTAVTDAAAVAPIIHNGIAWPEQKGVSP